MVKSGPVNTENNNPLRRKYILLRTNPIRVFLNGVAHLHPYCHHALQRHPIIYFLNQF